MRSKTRRSPSWRDKVWPRPAETSSRRILERSAPAPSAPEEPVRRGWTSELVRDATALIVAGLSVPAIAQAIRLPEEKVESKLGELGLLRRSRRRPTAHVVFEWTEERIAHAVRRWSEGVLASRIAEELSNGGETPVSKSAVIGKLTRMGLTGANADGTAPKRRTGRPLGFRKGLDFRIQ